MTRTSPLAIRWIAAYWPWIVRVSLLWITLLALTPPGSRAPLEPPQVVETSKPQVCVHTRLIDEVFEWKIQRSLQLVREMGANTIVEFFPWAYIENQENTYNWAQADRIVRHAQNQGIQIIARMGFVPEWAHPEIDDLYSTLNYLPDESFDDFADFVAQFAARYAGTIDHIIIWNEPNLAFEWGYRDVDPAGYVRLLQTVYGPVHAANPDVVILAAPLAPTLEPPGSPHGLNDILFLQALYEEDAGTYFDALAMHTYGFTDSAGAAPDPPTLNFRRAELLREVMERNGDAEKPVFITESGWNDHPRWTKAVRPSTRIANTIDSFNWAEENWPWLNKLCIWALRYPAPTFSYPDNFTLVTPDFQLKSIYYAIQAYARGWERSDTLWLPAPGG